ncbi:MAG: ATP synthase F0 subunit C [Eubacteriales bacterium]|nr:ATP synthase F0 subunit C [Eubacteriales bacterium]
MSAIGIIAIASAIAVLCGAASAIGMGLATSRAVDAIARQPEASGKINTSFTFGLIMMETIAIFALLVAILLIFVLAPTVS